MTQAAVDTIAGRLSLRPPQRRSLEILHRVTSLVPPRKGADLSVALAAVAAEFPTVAAFERDFPSLCFALATGVGKTRLMGAFISYLRVAHGVANFFVLAPNLTIYRKLIADFSPNTPKYVFRGVSEFAVAPPVITTGETYERQIASGGELFPTTINIFNISKINSEVRGGRSSRIRSFREEIGESYFDALAGLDDLVLIMDESHRYRGSAGMRAINELRPALGLELTATPFTEGARGPVGFRNVVYDYPLARAMADGFVKEPAVVTRENFSPVGKSAEDIQTIKLEDGIRLHESVRVELETYARQAGERIVKPFMLVIARDTAHAAELMALIGSDAFFEGRYAGKVIQVDSSVREDETIERLLKVEERGEPTEIVIHVNMLKEGWDVANLYTIVPLRAANARTLIEQSIGRGLRLPYGRRTGAAAVDRLNIVAHDRFQEIVEEARRADSPLSLRQVVLTDDAFGNALATLVSRPRLAAELGLPGDDGAAAPGLDEEPSAFDHEEGRVARIAYGVIRDLESRPERLPGAAHLRTPAVQAELLREVEKRYRPQAPGTDAAAPAPDLASVVARTAAIVARRTVDIPCIRVAPKGDARSGFHPFTLDLAALRHEAPSETLWAAHLRTGQVDRIGVPRSGPDDKPIEDILVEALADFDDVAYDLHADMLYDLADQVKRRLLASLSEDDARKVVRLHRQAIAALVHEQMQAHAWRDPAAAYDVVVTRGFQPLRDRAFTRRRREAALDFRAAPEDRGAMAGRLFVGFERCLYAEEKFQSDAERKLAIILDRESLKWFKPAKGQFQLYYRNGAAELEYQPDFVAETEDRIYMLEPKAANQMTDPDVRAKREAALEWCRRASAHAASHGGKTWTYLLVPHDAIAENMTIDGLARAHSPD